MKKENTIEIKEELHFGKPTGLFTVYYKGEIVMECLSEEDARSLTVDKIEEILAVVRGEKPFEMVRR